MPKKSKRLFEIDDLFRFSYALEAQLSPDGKRLVYTLMRTVEPKERSFSDLWLVELESGRSTQLTFGEWEDFSPLWSPDGGSLVFLSDRTGKVQAYLLSLQGGEACPLTALPQGIAGPILWSPRGDWLAFCAPAENPPDLSKPYRLTRPVIRFNGPGYCDPFIRQIYALRLKDGKLHKLTNDRFNHTPVAWSPDGKEILEMAGMDPDSFNFGPWLKAVDLQGNERVLLSNQDWTLSSALWLADGRITFVGVPSGKRYGTKNDLYVMQADGSGIDCRTASLPNTVAAGIHDDSPLIWSIQPVPVLPGEDLSEAITVVTNGGQVNLYQVRLDGPESARLLLGGERFCFPLSRRGNRVIFGISTLFDPTQLALLDIASSEERVLVSPNRKLVESIQSPEVRQLSFASSDGAAVEGWMLLPAQGKPPYPTILHIHGGPHAVYGYGFSFDFLTLAGLGYAVLFVNHRGSVGYGDEFATATHADWGHLDYDDLMAGVDRAVALGLADPERLGCCGVSGGGNLSCWIVGHTDRFKAAVPENPVTNFVSMYGTSDISPVYLVNELGGKPHEAPEVYARCSPITYAHRCKTPTLLVTGENDYRCPSEQAEQFYTVLRANGCPAEMLRLPNSSHSASSDGAFAVRRAHNEALVEWFGRWIK